MPSIVGAFEILLRLAVGFSGLMFLTIALFLYEDEEGAIQNRLENCWIRIHDLRRSAMSFQAAFILQVSRIVSAVLDRLFGRKLFSLRAAGAAACVAAASGGFSGLAVQAASPLRIFPPDPWVPHYLLGLGLFYLVAAILGAWWPKLIAWALAPIVLYTVLMPLSVPFALAQSRDLGLVLFLLLQPVGLVSLVLSLAALIALVRWALRPRALESQEHIPVRVIAAVGPVALTALGLAWFSGGYRLRIPVPLILTVVGVGIYSSVLAVPGAMFITLAGLLVIHNLFWSTVSRPLYAVVRERFSTKRKLFALAGLALCTLALSNVADWSTIMAKMLRID